MSKLVLLLLIMLPQWALAQVYEGGDFKVQSIRVEQTSVKVRFSPAPKHCQGGDFYRMHAVVPYSQNGAKEMVSSLLAAYSAGIKIKYLFFSNAEQACSSSHILNLDMFELEYK